MRDFGAKAIGCYMDFGKLKAHKPRGDTRKKELNIYPFPAPVLIYVRLAFWIFSPNLTALSCVTDILNIRRSHMETQLEAVRSEQAFVTWTEV